MPLMLDAEAENQANKIGIADFIYKPFSIRDLK
jgi:FixJ family two-component response regulator